MCGKSGIWGLRVHTVLQTKTERNQRVRTEKPYLYLGPAPINSNIEIPLTMKESVILKYHSLEGAKQTYESCLATFILFSCRIVLIGKSPK